MRPGADGPGQPRPALGLRPWFAFLRRALRLRRLAFAMGAERNSRPRLYRIEGPGWGVAAVLAAPHRRLAGLRPVPGPLGMLLHTRSIHTAGMSAPIAVVSVGRDGLVRRAMVVGPGRLFVDRGAAWVLECGPGSGLPAVGDRLVVRPILRTWPAR
jgi:hypothetical protein